MRPITPILSLVDQLVGPRQRSGPTAGTRHCHHRVVTIPETSSWTALPLPYHDWALSGSRARGSILVLASASSPKGRNQGLQVDVPGGAMIAVDYRLKHRRVR
jgi:hypothetical protein